MALGFVISKVSFNGTRFVLRFQGRSWQRVGVLDSEINVGAHNFLSEDIAINPGA